ncbi:MAG TPA: DUF4097 family beta strand repeat-containing protein [Blastocatellia bacterium]|nr:DUF4097 family beta strand repeat-containing protein [Blastocatellia bacterium]
MTKPLSPVEPGRCRPPRSVRGWQVLLGLAIAGCLLAASRAGLNASAQTPDQGREVHETYDLAPNGVVSVNNPSGNIRVTSWNENRVKVDAVKRGRRDDELNQVEIQIAARPEKIEIRSIYRGQRSNGAAVDYELKVPRTAQLSSLNSVSGEITVAGPVARVDARTTSGNVAVREVAGIVNLASISGEVEAERIGGELRASSTSGNVTATDLASRLYAASSSGSVTAVQVRDDATVSVVSGNIKLDRVGGRALVRSLNGTISIHEVGGDVKAESTSSHLTITNVRGSVTAAAVSGNLTIGQVDQGVRASSVSGRIEINESKGRIEVNTTSDAVTLNNIDSRYVQAKSHSGSLKFVGKLYEDGTYEFVSFAGNVVLILPGEDNFRLTAKTNSGSLKTEFPIQIGGGGGPGFQNRELSGVVGRGGAEIRAVSFSGDISIRKSAGQNQK